MFKTYTDVSGKYINGLIDYRSDGRYYFKLDNIDIPELDDYDEATLGLIAEEFNSVKRELEKLNKPVVLQRGI